MPRLLVVASWYTMKAFLRDSPRIRHRRSCSLFPAPCTLPNSAKYQKNLPDTYHQGHQGYQYRIIVMVYRQVVRFYLLSSQYRRPLQCIEQLLGLLSVDVNPIRSGTCETIAVVTGVLIQPKKLLTSFQESENQWKPHPIWTFGGKWMQWDMSRSHGHRLQRHHARELSMNLESPWCTGKQSATLQQSWIWILSSYCYHSAIYCYLMILMMCMYIYIYIHTYIYIHILYTDMYIHWYLHFSSWRIPQDTCRVWKIVEAWEDYRILLLKSVGVKNKFPLCCQHIAFVKVDFMVFKLHCSQPVKYDETCMYALESINVLLCPFFCMKWAQAHVVFGRGLGRGAKMSGTMETQHISMFFGCFSDDFRWFRMISDDFLCLGGAGASAEALQLSAGSRSRPDGVAGASTFWIEEAEFQHKRHVLLTTP